MVQMGGMGAGMFGRGCDLLGWGNGGLDGGVWSVERGGKVGWMGVWSVGGYSGLDRGMVDWIGV